jgi:ADP-heptose:LPS heptosyltransferase
MLFGGGKKEIELLDNLANKFPTAINIAGKLKLNQELALISNLDVMVSMDSGNAHFAAMLGINTITIWGITHPFAGFAPFNQPFENSILPDLNKYPNIPCSIYGNKVCKGYEDVMRSISPKTIIKKVLEAID